MYAPSSPLQPWQKSLQPSGAAKPLKRKLRAQAPSRMVLEQPDDTPLDQRFASTPVGQRQMG